MNIKKISIGSRQETDKTKITNLHPLSWENTNLRYKKNQINFNNSMVDITIKNKNVGSNVGN